MLNLLLLCQMRGVNSKIREIAFGLNQAQLISKHSQGWLFFIVGLLVPQDLLKKIGLRLLSTVFRGIIIYLFFSRGINIYLSRRTASEESIQQLLHQKPTSSGHNNNNNIDIIQENKIKYIHIILKKNDSLQKQRSTSLLTK